MFESYFAFLEGCFAWVFGSLLEEPVFALITKCLEYYLGIWFLYILLVVPILNLLKSTEYYLFR